MDDIAKKSVRKFQNRQENIEQIKEVNSPKWKSGGSREVTPFYED